MGGKMALVASDMNRRFSSLWQGQQLAFTVLIITVAVAAAYYLTANLIASGIENNRDEVPPMLLTRQILGDKTDENSC